MLSSIENLFFFLFNLLEEFPVFFSLLSAVLHLFHLIFLLHVLYEPFILKQFVQLICCFCLCSNFLSRVNCSYSDWSISFGSDELDNEVDAEEKCQQNDSINVVSKVFEMLLAVKYNEGDLENDEQY